MYVSLCDVGFGCLDHLVDQDMLLCSLFYPLYFGAILYIILWYDKLIIFNRYFILMTATYCYCRYLFVFLLGITVYYGEDSGISCRILDK